MSFLPQLALLGEGWGWDQCMKNGLFLAHIPPQDLLMWDKYLEKWGLSWPGLNSGPSWQTGNGNEGPMWRDYGSVPWVFVLMFCRHKVRGFQEPPTDKDGMVTVSPVGGSSMCVCCAQLYLTLCNPADLYPAKLLCLWDYLGKNTGVGCHFLLQGNLPDPGIEPTSPVSPALAGRFFITEPPGKPWEGSSRA